MIIQDIPYSIKRSIVFLSGFPGISADEESACNIGDPSLIPELGRSPGKRIGYPLQYSWASLVAQSVKNPSAMQRTGFDPWVGKFPLEKGMVTHFSMLAWRIPWTEDPDGLQSMGLQRVAHDWANNTCRKKGGKWGRTKNIWRETGQYTFFKLTKHINQKNIQEFQQIQKWESCTQLVDGVKNQTWVSAGHIVLEEQQKNDGYLLIRINTGQKDNETTSIKKKRQAALEF